MKYVELNRFRGDKSLRILALCAGLLIGIFYASFGRSIYRRLTSTEKKNYTVTTSTESIAQYNETAAFLVRDDTTLSDALAKQIPVLCVVHRNNFQNDHIESISNTWGSRCTKVLFYANQYSNDSKIISLKRNDTHQPTAEDLFRHIFMYHKNDFNWFLNTDGDTYVVMENLRYLLYPYDSSQAIAIGYRKNGTYTVVDSDNSTMIETFHYYSGAAGYVISKEALTRLELAFRTGNKCEYIRSIKKKDDELIGVCLDEMNVHAAISEDQHGKKRFIEIRLEDYLLPVAETKLPYPWYSDYKVDHRLDKISNYSVTFHGMNSHTMYVFEYLIYQLRPYGLEYELPPLPTAISFPDVPSTPVV